MFALILATVLAGNVSDSTERAPEVSLPRTEIVKPNLVRVSTIIAPNEGTEVALSGVHKDAPRTELKEIPWETVLNLCF